MKKSRDHQRLIITMAHMYSNLVWQIDLTLSSSEYLNVLKWIVFFFKDLPLREISRHGEIWQEGTPHYTLVKN